MEKEKQKIYYNDKAVSIGSIIFTILLSITAVIFLICSIFSGVFLALGIVFSVIVVICWFVLFFARWYIVLNIDTITLTTLFGRVLNEKKRADLVKIETFEQKVVDRLSISGKKKYIFMCFTEKDVFHDCLRDSIEEPDLMLVLYSTQKLKILENYFGVSDKKQQHKGKSK